MEFIKSWISNICAALIFITAVDLVLPDNNIKKYCKLVLGLILMVVVINPLISLLDKDFSSNINLDNYLLNGSASTVNSYGEIKSSLTEKEFKRAVENEALLILNKALPDYSFNVEAEIEFKGIEEAEIKEISISYSDASVKKIDNINIGKSHGDVGANNSGDDVLEKTIIDILYEQGSISKKMIKVYKN